MFVMFSFEKALSDLGWASGKTYINTIEVLNLRLFHTLKNRIKLSRFKQLCDVFCALETMLLQAKTEGKIPNIPELKLSWNYTRRT